MVLKLLIYISLVIIFDNQIAVCLPFPSDHDLEEMIYKDENLISEHSEINERENILFYLYTQDNPTESYQLFVDDIPLLQSSPFNQTHSTKILIHGWTDSVHGAFIQTIKNVYLEDKNVKLNVITIDWSALCDGINYLRAAKNIIPVGKYIAKFLDFLVDNVELNLSDLHIIGHSLGAHTAGNVGRRFTNPGGKVHRITGLDPALPLFTSFGKKLLRSITKDDAEFVDIIHTDAGVMGVLDPIGHVDFYPNGGTSFQPGCKLNLTTSCNHARAWIYYEESVRNKNAFPTKPCNNLKEALAEECDSLLGSDNSPNMGEYAYYDDEFKNGLFYTKTNEKSPFSINDY